MAKSQTSKRDAEHEVTRRALIKWSLAAGAALGVSRAGVFEILERTAGKGLAFAASELPTKRSMHLVAGNGGFAWFQLLFPHTDVALAANPTFAWHKPGMATLINGTKKPLVRGPDTPFATLSPQRQITAFMSGQNQTHTDDPETPVTLGGNKITAVIGALQANSPSVVPTIVVGGLAYGTAPGAPNATAVAQATGMVDLFNSAASRAGGLLSQSRDATLYKAHYDAFAQLNRAANRSTTKSSYVTASGAAQFLGTNLAAKLQIAPEDLTRYGINGNTRANVAAIARTMIISVKAFKMGLTNSVMLRAMNDDPHGAFTGGDVNTVPAQLKTVFDAFMTDLTNTVDDNTQRALSDDFVMSIHGDTPKTPLAANGWPDGTPGGSNWMYVWGGGDLYTGWYGGIDRNGNVRGFDANGNDAAFNGANCARLATASLAYAVAKRDERLISQFANGIQIADRFGPAKVQ
ncbi:MAG TPA: hypothetical protein VNO30_30385 [Kofleriaceae bacterium]|nr:hypothetical protein [Kofleriaceae bacterium]